MKKVILLTLSCLHLLALSGCYNNTISEIPTDPTAATLQATEGTSIPPNAITETTPTGTVPQETIVQTETIPSTMELLTFEGSQYYLYTPSNPTANMPLIIYLHGGTNKSADVTALLTLDGFPKYLYEGYYSDLRAFVAVPKLDSNYKGWVNAADHIRNLIEKIHSDHAIDKGKVALTGHSMGGTGTYQLQARLPQTFACIAPMSGSIQNTEKNLTALGKTKVWAFVGTKDTVVEPASSMSIVASLKENGANAAITELEGATHTDVPSLAYKNPELIQWLVNCGQ